MIADALKQCRGSRPEPRPFPLSPFFHASSSKTSQYGSALKAQIPGGKGRKMSCSSCDSLFLLVLDRILLKWKEKMPVKSKKADINELKRARENYKGKENDVQLRTRSLDRK